MSLLLPSARATIMLLAAVLLLFTITAHASAINSRSSSYILPRALVATRQALGTCSDAGSKSCGISSFCCPSSTECIPLEDNTSVICCNVTDTCKEIHPITCSSSSTSKQPKCGTECCPIGFECDGTGTKCLMKPENLLGKYKNATSTAESSTDTGSPSNPDFPAKAVLVGLIPGILLGAGLVLLYQKLTERHTRRRSIKSFGVFLTDSETAISQLEKTPEPPVPTIPAGPAPTNTLRTLHLSRNNTTATRSCPPTRPTRSNTTSYPTRSNTTSQATHSNTTSQATHSNTTNQATRSNSTSQATRSNSTSQATHSTHAPQVEAGGAFSPLSFEFRSPTPSTTVSPLRIHIPPPATGNTAYRLPPPPSHPNPYPNRRPQSGDSNTTSPDYEEESRRAVDRHNTSLQPPGRWRETVYSASVYTDRNAEGPYPFVTDREVPVPPVPKPAPLFYRQGSAAMPRPPVVGWGGRL